MNTKNTAYIALLLVHSSTLLSAINDAHTCTTIKLHFSLNWLLLFISRDEPALFTKNSFVISHLNEKTTITHNNVNGITSTQDIIAHVLFHITNEATIITQKKETRKKTTHTHMHTFLFKSSYLSRSNRLFVSVSILFLFLFIVILILVRNFHLCLRFGI